MASASSGIWVIIEQNPVILWGGLILALLVFILVKHMEKKEEGDMEAPRPSSLEEIAKPKVKQHVESRGKEPSQKIRFKIGRNVKGYVTKYVETKLPEKLINPNPRREEEDNFDDEETEVDPEEQDLVEVRIIMIRPGGYINKLKQIILQMLGQYDKLGGNENFYIFRKSSFLDTPDPSMVLDPDVLSYTFAGMEVEIDDSTRNVVNQAVQTEVSEAVLAALPNYTEKVDFLFPLYSQDVGKIKAEGEHLNEEEEGF